MANQDKPKRKYIWVCAYCGFEFEGNYSQRYCCPSHKQRAYEDRRYRRQNKENLVPEKVEKVRLKDNRYSKNRNFSLKLRYQILERDNFKCVKCGRGSKEGAILHVDHVYPKKYGGEASLENGQTLCSECNIGKGAQISERTQHSVHLTLGTLPSN